jgi:hypothetical protein
MSIWNVKLTLELRQAIRYRLQAPVVFSWESPRHDTFKGDGFTRDISTMGAYVVSVSSPPVGALINVEVICVPSSGENGLRLSAPGRVVRTEYDREKEQSGFAFVADGFVACSELESK